MGQAFKAGLREPFSLANLLLLSAADHLSAILRLREDGPLPQFALYTLLRSAAEATVRARYLLDEGITETRRLARSLNERLDNVIEQRRVDPATTQPHFDAAVARFEEVAVANGITPLREKRSGSIHAFDEPRKNLIDLFTEYLPEDSGEGAFRFLSGFTHSRPWVQLRPHRATPSSEPGVADVPLDMDVTLFSNVLTIVIGLFDEDMRLWVEAAGYPVAAWTAVKHAPPRPR
jgi:hypothetical protein